MGLSAQSEQVYQHPWEQVWEAVLRAIPGVPKMAVRQADRSNGRITVNKGFSWKSWGEDIVVDVYQPEPGKAAVRAQSSVKAQLIDWGVNKANVAAILEAVSRGLGSPQAAPSGKQAAQEPPPTSPPPASPSEG